MTCDYMESLTRYHENGLGRIAHGLLGVNGQVESVSPVFSGADAQIGSVDYLVITWPATGMA